MSQFHLLLTVRNNCFFQSYNSPNFWTLFTALPSYLQSSMLQLVSLSFQMELTAAKIVCFPTSSPKAINALGTLLAFQVTAGKFYQMLP